jgi:alpha-L-fucosidase
VTASLAYTPIGESIPFRLKVPNGTWYANHLYTNPNGPERKYHEATYGPLEKFGYKDFIPMFTGEKFNANEWADLFQKAGARFAGPVAEHHDGFSMWDTKYSEWNAAKMGPSGMWWANSPRRSRNAT